MSDSWQLRAQSSPRSTAWVLGTAELEGAFVSKTASVHTLYLGVPFLTLQVTSHHKAHSAPQQGNSIRISLHPHRSEESPYFLLDWVKDLSLSFPISTHSCHVVALISLIMACPVLDYRHLWSEFRCCFLVQLLRPLWTWAVLTFSLGRLLTSPLFSVHWVQIPFSAPTLCQEDSKYSIDNNYSSPYISLMSSDY